MQIFRADRRDEWRNSSCCHRRHHTVVQNFSYIQHLGIFSSNTLVSTYQRPMILYSSMYLYFNIVVQWNSRYVCWTLHDGDSKKKSPPGEIACRADWTLPATQSVVPLAALGGPSDCGYWLWRLRSILRRQRTRKCHAKSPELRNCYLFQYWKTLNLFQNRNNT